MRKTHLWISLSDMALDFVDQLPEDKTYTYEDMCKAMDQRFGSERLATVYRAELKHRTTRTKRFQISDLIHGYLHPKSTLHEME